MRLLTTCTVSIESYKSITCLLVENHAKLWRENNYVVTQLVDMNTLLLPVNKIWRQGRIHPTLRPNQPYWHPLACRGRVLFRCGAPRALSYLDEPTRAIIAFPLGTVGGRRDALVVWFLMSREAEALDEAYWNVRETRVWCLPPKGRQVKNHRLHDIFEELRCYFKSTVQTQRYLYIPQYP